MVAKIHHSRPSGRRRLPRKPRIPALRPRDARFRFLVENSSDIFFSMRLPEGRYEYISARVADIHGISPQEFYDDPSLFLERCVAPHWRDEMRSWAAEILQGRLREKYEFEVLDKDGRLRWIEQRMVLVPAPDGRGFVLQGVASDHTREHEAALALRQREERFRLLAEAWPEQVMLSVNLTSGRHEYVSPNMERVLGYRPEEFYADPGLGMAVVAPQWREAAEAWIEEIKAGLLRPHYEFELVHKNGEHRFVRQAGALLPREPDGDVRVQFTFHDITRERQGMRQLEKSEALFRELAEGWREQVVIRINLASGRHEYVGRSMERVFGFTPEQFYAGDLRAVDAVAPEWREQAGRWIAEARAGRLAPEYEYEIIDGRGRRRWVYQRGVLLRDADGTPSAVQFVLFDNTERKTLEQQLAESERKLRGLVEHLRDGYAATDLSGRITEHNSAFRDMLGYSGEELGRLSYRDITPEYWHDMELRILAAQVEPRGYSDVYEKEYCSKDGRLIPVEMRTQLLRDASGAACGYWAIARDISGRKAAEEALAHKDALLSAMLRNLPFDFWARDTTLASIMQSDESIRIWGDLSAGDESHVAPETRDAWRDTDRKVMAQSPLTEERTLRLPSGEVRTFQSVVAQIRDGEAMLGLLGINVDITERKAAEAALRESTRRFDQLVRTIPVGVYVFGARATKRVFEYVSPMLCEITGIAEADFLRSTDAFHAACHPDDLEGLLQAGYRALELQGPYWWEGRFVVRGQPRWLRIESVPTPVADGLVWHGVVSDLTERKAAEVALAHKDALLSAMLRNLPFDFWARDTAGRIVVQSDESLRLWGNLKDLTVDDPAFDVRTQELWRANNARAFAGEIVSEERQLRTKDHGVRDFHNVVAAIRDGEQVLGLLGVNIDITERKAAEEALSRSERRFAELIRNSFDTVNILDEQGNQVFVSDAVERILGFTAAELTGIAVIEEMLHPEDQGRVREAFARVFTEGKGWVQYRHRHKDGSWVHLEAWATNQLDNPDIRGVVVNVRDISDRKLAEEALARSSRLWRKLLESMHEGVWAVDATRRTTFVNERLAAMCGYGVDELAHMQPMDLLDPGQAQEALERFQERRLGLAGCSDYTITCKDGTLMPARVSSAPILDEHGAFEGLVCSITDLTESRGMEEQLRRNQARFEALYELSRLRAASERQMSAFTLRQALRLTDSTAGVLFFVGPDGESLEAMAFEGAPDWNGRRSFSTRGPSPWAAAIASRQPLILNDFSPFAGQLPAGHIAVARFLCVPALDGDSPAAVLGLAGKTLPYTQDDSLQVSLLLDGMWRVVRSRRDDARIHASLREKEALLREVHHRVKNNLQVVSSLLDMAGRRLPDESRRSMEEVRAKVQAMGLVHAQLHGEDAAGGIDLERYVLALFRQLREVYSGDMDLTLEMRLEKLLLGLDQATPLGLVLNEALANVFKHARRAGRAGRVHIGAWRDEEGWVHIVVRDEGPGLPPGLEPERAPSLGMRLMFGLVRRQLGGDLTVSHSAPGTEVRIRFRPTLPNDK